MIEKFDSLFKYLQLVTAYISPPIVSAFVWGLFWKRANAQGAFTSMMVGLAFAFLLLLSQSTDALPFLSTMHFLHVAPILFVFCSLILVLVSLMTAPPMKRRRKE